MRTSCCLAFSAGGKYGGSGAFKRNADANVEKYNMMFPAISRRSLLTEMTKSRRKLYIEKKKTPDLSIDVPCQPRRRSVLPYTYIHSHTVAQVRWYLWLKRGFAYHSSRVVTHRILWSLSSIV